jgi:E3 ubiquitin-protein ligase XIAP
MLFNQSLWFITVELVARFESNRLATFRQWPESSPIRPQRLAAAGLFYFGQGDSVRCAFCEGVLKRWVPGDDPMEEHSKFFPRCPFVIGLDIGNVPLSSDTTSSSSFPIAYRQASALFLITYV